MSKPWLLDTGPLGRLTNPGRNPAISTWLERELDAGVSVMIPEIADYELRRSFLLEGLARSLRRLDQLVAALPYLPLTTSVMRTAARLWADVRRRGHPLADPHALDGDAMLAAQALAVGGRVATENPGHLTWLVEAVDWRVAESGP